MGENVFTDFSPASSCFTSPCLLQTWTDTLGGTVHVQVSVGCPSLQVTSGFTSSVPALPECHAPFSRFYESGRGSIRATSHVCSEGCAGRDSQWNWWSDVRGLLSDGSDAV